MNPIEISLKLRTPTESKLATFYITSEKDKELIYLTGLSRAYEDIYNWTQSPEADILPGSYSLEVIGAKQIYDHKFAESMLWSKDIKHQSQIGRVVKDIFVYLLAMEVDNIFFARRKRRRDEPRGNESTSNGEESSSRSSQPTEDWSGGQTEE